MIKIIISFLLGLGAGYILASFLSNRKRFVVNVDKETGETTIEQVNRPKKKVEFITEPTKEEVEEAERPKGLGKFLDQFKKPAKQEEEEEEI